MDALLYKWSITEDIQDYHPYYIIGWYGSVPLVIPNGGYYE